MSRLPRVLIAESIDFSRKAISSLRQFVELKLEDLDRNELLEIVAWADVLWVRLGNYIDSHVFEAAENLRIIVTPTTGLNHIDLEEAEKRDIAVLSLKGEIEFLREIRATAEQTIALMLCLIRKIPSAYDHVLAGGWNRDLFKGSELYGKTVGIIGYGRLGRIVGNYLHAFGAKLLVTDPVCSQDTVFEYVEVVELDRLLSESDIITLHASYTAGNKVILNQKEFQRIKKGAIFINTSRGELINEFALVEVLESGQMESAALDVISAEAYENPADSVIVKFARSNREHVLITPHIGGCTVESFEKTEMFLVDRLEILLNRFK